MCTNTVAVFGGAFDPVHQDHLTLAKLCLSLKFCDELWFVPSPDRWDKTLFASAEDRLEMLRIGIGSVPHIRISDSELRMEEYRGSYVSLCALKGEYPGIRFRLLVGADSYGNIPHWRDPKHFFGTEYNGEQLLREFELIVFNRHGFPMPSAEEHLAKGFAPILTVGEPEGFCGKYSSTEIRRGLFFGHACPPGLSPEVYRYIVAHKLYRE